MAVKGGNNAKKVSAGHVSPEALRLSHGMPDIVAKGEPSGPDTPEPSYGDLLKTLFGSVDPDLKLGY